MQQGEAVANSTVSPRRQAHRFLQVGMLLFLLSLIVGFVVPRFAVPRIALSAHLLGIMQGLFLVVVGLLWPRLALGRLMSQLLSWLAIYGCIAAWAANVLAAVWGAGNSMLPIAAGAAYGSVFQELVIRILLRSAGVSLVITLVLVLWGLRTGAGEEMRGRDLSRRGCGLTPRCSELVCARR
jgi:(hydroxyamino)benzene mutase